MARRTRYWVVLAIYGWECFKSGGLSHSAPPPSDPAQPCGFLPVFTTKRAATALADGQPVTEWRLMAQRDGE